MKWDKALERAVHEAERGMKKGDGGPFGAVILRGGKVFASSHNTVLKANDPTSHAEINAIRSASRKKSSPFFRDCVMVTTTEPCPMCFSAIHWGRFKAVVFSTTIHDVKKLGFNELRIPATVMRRRGRSRVKLIRVENKACDGLIKKWKRSKFRKTY